jgi:signal peptidase II
MPHGDNRVKKSTVIVIIASIEVVLDYFTKMLILQKVGPMEVIPVFPFMNIVHVENRGAAFGMLTSLGNNFFIIISLLAILFILIYLSKLPKGLELYSLSMILGGAVGNLIDRVKIGKVVDFIDVYAGSWHWPAFNVADAALTVGIVLFLMANLKQTRHYSAY